MSNTETIINQCIYETVYVVGVFDMFHRGHVELLRRSRALGERLVVALNGDEMVRSYKRLPIYSEQDRLAIVKACRYVDEAFIIREYDNKPALLEHQVSAVVHGDDWTGDDYLKQICVDQKFLDKHGIEMIYLPTTKGVSTTDLIERIRNIDSV